MTTKIIDIALLPPDDIIELCTEYNRQLHPENIIFDSACMFPHITLLMGGADAAALVRVHSALSELVNNFAPLPLEIATVYEAACPAFVITTNDTLYSLHKQVVEAIASLLSYDNSADSIYNNMQEEAKKLEWVCNYVNNFLSDSAQENFQPHITLGDGKIDAAKITLPIQFVADRLVVCHLGTFCTCREILFEFNLR